MNRTFLATSALIGSIVGAGFLAIPYVINQSGFSIGLLHIVIIAIIVTIAMLYLGEIALRTKSKHHLAGYAEKYIGKGGKRMMFFAVAFGVFSALTAYIIAEGESLSFIFFASSDYSALFGICFWAVLSVLSIFGIKAFKRGEEIGFILICILFVVVSILFINDIDIKNLSTFNLNHFMTPFGVILFSFLAFTAIPEIEIILSNHNKQSLLKKTIILAYVFCAIMYILFSIFVIGSQGDNTPQISTLKLGPLFILIGIVTMFGAYLSQSIAIIDSLTHDFNKKKKNAWLITILVPLIAYILLLLYNKAQFTLLIGIGGVISGGLTAALIIDIVKKAKLHGDRIPEYSIPCPSFIAWLLIFIFIIGAIFEIIRIIY